MKYTQARVNKIIKTLKNIDDMSRVEAVEKCGITYKVFMEWQRNYPDFKQLVDEADAEVYQKKYTDAENCIYDSIKKSPRWAAWFLERTNPEKYGRSEKIEQDLNITGVDITYVKPKKDDE